MLTLHHDAGHRQEAIRHYRQALELIHVTGDQYPEVDALIGLTTATAEPPTRPALAVLQRATS